MPASPIAYLALILWGPVVIFTFRRLDPVRATIWLVLGAIMFLPELVSFDPPLVPPLGKNTLSTLFILVGILFTARERVSAARPLRGVDLLFVLTCIGSIGTALTNTDAQVFGQTVLPGTSLYDGVAMIIRDTLSIYLPFLIGRAMVRTERDLHVLLEVLVQAGLVYSLLAIVEVVMSPQLHRWLYGFHQMQFAMTIRYGGYRPMIFMMTGMAVALFLLSALIAATALYRNGHLARWKAYYLGGILVVCKSTGALVYAVVAVPLTATKKRLRRWVPATLAALSVLYPLLSKAGLFPHVAITRFFETISEERAFSLWFRFFNERQLLARADERMVFGWGGYARNRVYDPFSGEDLSVTDGNWIIELGSRGLWGFLTLYLLLTIPIFIASRRVASVREPGVKREVYALMLIASLNVVDLLPNGLFHYLPYFYAGALMGVVQGLMGRSEGRRVRRIAA